MGDLLLNINVMCAVKLLATGVQRSERETSRKRRRDSLMLQLH